MGTITYIRTICQYCGVTFDARPANVKRGWDKHCSPKCAQANRTATIRANFWTFTNRADGCWLWSKGVAADGYAHTVPTAGEHLAHRISWTLTHGPIPDGLKVCHTCDVRHCINPAHLFLGTNADNTADMVQKGRHVHGERHPLHRLTAEQIADIRARYAAGGIPQWKLAEEYGVSQAIISKICRGQVWKHIAAA